MGFFEWLMGEEPGLLEKLAHCDDKGHYGEYLAKYALGNDNIIGYSKVLCNIYVPYKGKTSEIDVLLIHEKGLFVFESKNYSGWIFGSAEQKNWTQCLNAKTKNKFYNPIMQNNTHINAISTFLELPKAAFNSYILFSDRCEFKKVPDNCEQYIIIHRKDLLKNLRPELKKRDKIYTKEKVDEIYNLLFPLTQVTEEEKQKHIENIKNSP